MKTLNKAPQQGVAPNRFLVRELGVRDYEPVWHEMQAFTAERDAQTQDEIWLVEHPAVFTLGLNGKQEHVLDPGTIPVILADRGGQVTYHGPGQLVVYLLLDITRRGLGVRQLVTHLEQTLIGLLADYDIITQARPDAPGVYVGDAKIAALGLRIKHGRCYHGLALNVNMDLSPFSRINPCGYPDLPVTQLADLGGPQELPPVASALIKHLSQKLGYNTSPQN